MKASLVAQICAHVAAELEALDKFLKSELERLEHAEAALIKQLNSLRSDLLKILSTNQ